MKIFATLQIKLLIDEKEISYSGRILGNEQLKNRHYLWRPIKPRTELEEIFRGLKIKILQFDVKECIPTDIEVF